MMKRIIFGSAMMLAGIIGTALLMAGSMMIQLPINNDRTFIWGLSKYGLDYAFYTFIIVAIIGLIIGISEIFSKQK